MLKNSSRSEQIRNALEDKHFEVEALREIATDLKARKPAYVPVKEDPIDVALG